VLRGWRDAGTVRKQGQIAKLAEFCEKLKATKEGVSKDTPTANLLLALAHLGGAEIESLPASTGRLEL